MTVRDHQHGVIDSRCDHPDCRAAFARYAKRWRIDRSRGLFRKTDTDAVRLHIAALRGQGWSLRAIAGAAGISPTAVSRYAAGQGICIKTAAIAILSLDPDTLPSRPSRGTNQVFVSRVGTVRRIQALMAIGYSHTDLIRAGINRSHNLLSQQGRWVTRTTHDKVADVYRTLATRPGPTPRAAREAAKRGYVSPIGWEDIDHDVAPYLDDDGAELIDGVDEAVVLRILGGDLVPATRAERIEIVRRWTSSGRPLRALDELTGWKVERYVVREDSAA